MRILVNGEAADVTGEWRTVQELVQVFYGNGENAGQMLAEVVADGRTLSFCESEDAVLEGVETLELRTVPSARAFQFAAMEVAHRLGLIRDVLREIVAAFREGREDEAQRALAQTVPHLQGVLNEANEIDQAKATLLRLDTDDRVCHDDPHALSGAFQQIVEAQERRDDVLVADLLEFELLPAIESWESALIERYETPTTLQ